jgi:hypothetical protein
VTPFPVAHLYGVPVEELFTAAAAGGGAIWVAARIYVSSLAAKARR